MTERRLRGRALLSHSFREAWRNLQATRTVHLAIIFIAPAILLVVFLALDTGPLI